MIQIIIKQFIANPENATDKHVRESYGVLAGILGVICNLLLFVIKLSIGLFINSIAVISDAFNNLTDLGSSLVAIFGAKLSNRPPDREHPYGHGRFEYITALVVSFLIFSVGLELLRSSFGKIVNPEKVLFNPTLILILVLSLSLKLWMYSYNKYIGDKINSSINRATAIDSINDVVATSAVIITTVIGNYIAFPVDGLVGVAISLLILYTGFSIASDTVNLLLGSSPDPELIETINSLVANDNLIIGTHDLKVHDYGPGRVVASVHAEVPDNLNLVEVHSVIDELEVKIADELGIDLVIHIDPITMDTAKNALIGTMISNTVQGVNAGCRIQNLRIQNLRITGGNNRTNIIFDLLVPSSVDQSDHEGLIISITEEITKKNSKYNVVMKAVDVDRN